jgi:hypothetical protein
LSRRLSQSLYHRIQIFFRHFSKRINTQNIFSNKVITVICLW